MYGNASHSPSSIIRFDAKSHIPERKWLGFFKVDRTNIHSKQKIGLHA